MGDETMNRKQLGKKMEQQIRKSILSYALYRPESAVVIAMTIIFMWLSLANVSWFPGQWWLWLLFGLTGEALIVRSTLRDEKFYQSILDELFDQKFDINKLRSADLRQKLAKMYEYRTLIVKEIKREDNPVLDDYLFNVARGIESWISHVYHLAQGLDTYRRDPVIARDMETVPKELEKFERLLANEQKEPVRAELEKTIAAKQAQWDTLRNLQDTMSKAQLQLENTLSAVGTVYTQVVLLGSKDINSHRAQRLQADIAEQVRALEDICTTVDEIYQVSA